MGASTDFAFYYDLFSVKLMMQYLVFLGVRPSADHIIVHFTGVELLDLGPFKSFVGPTHRGWRLHPARIRSVAEGIFLLVVYRLLEADDLVPWLGLKSSNYHIPHDSVCVCVCAI